MTSPTVPLLRVIPSVLFCLTLTGAADTAESAGPVVGWGYDTYGQATPPDAVNGVSGTATDIAAGGEHSEPGGEHSCAIQAGTGEVVCWGRDNLGQATPPDTVNGVSGTATDITAGGIHSCAIQAGTANAVCWGADRFGQATPPDAVTGVSGSATGIAAGGFHSCAIQAGTGEVFCWGSNCAGPAAPPDAVNGVSGTATDIASGIDHNCAIQAGTGNVVCWGRDDFGQARAPDSVNGVGGTATAVAAGFRHSCAIQAGTGNAVCWGTPNRPRSRPPAAVNGVSGTATDIAAGRYHSCAIQAGTGEVFCWGDDYYGQSTPPPTVNGVSGTAIGIAAGGSHTLAIVGPPEPIRFTKPQRACVIAMNKSGEKVNKAQLNENERCLRDFQAERLVAPMTFDDCMTADRRGRVQRVWNRTAIREGRKCDSLEVPPPIAYTDSATVNAAAVDGALALTYKIFGGSPVLDSNLFTNTDDREAARCQLELLRRADNLEYTVLKQINEAKRRALRDETIDSKAAFEATLQAVLSSNARITRAQDRLVRWVDRKCAVLQVPPDTIFPGACGAGDPSLNEVEACVIAAARREACLKINAFDDLNLDCD
jgi:hypothetical protein